MDLHIVRYAEAGPTCPEIRCNDSIDIRFRIGGSTQLWDLDVPALPRTQAPSATLNPEGCRTMPDCPPARSVHETCLHVANPVPEERGLEPASAIAEQAPTEMHFVQICPPLKECLADRSLDPRRRDMT